MCLGHSVISISLYSSLLLISTTLLEIRVHAHFVSSVPTAVVCELWVLWVMGGAELNCNWKQEEGRCGACEGHGPSHIKAQMPGTNQGTVCHTELLVKMNLGTGAFTITE